MAEPPSTDSAERLAIARRRWDAHPLHQYFGLSLDDLDNGFARCSLLAAAGNRGGVHGSVHGGILAFIADAIALAAVSTVLAPGERSAGTAELNISYLRPAMGAVVGQARILRKGRTLVVADVDLSDATGKLLAKGRVSYALRDSAGQETSDGTHAVDGAR
jgi:uncharacterized protein (TIGR00369 family)